jgi:hypothetical protein
MLRCFLRPAAPQDFERVVDNRRDNTKSDQDAECPTMFVAPPTPPQCIVRNNIQMLHSPTPTRWTGGQAAIDAAYKRLSGAIPLTCPSPAGGPSGFRRPMNEGSRLVDRHNALLPPPTPPLVRNYAGELEGCNVGAFFE